jgi:hypothetical protein
MQQNTNTVQQNGLCGGKQTKRGLVSHPVQEKASQINKRSAKLIWSSTGTG